MIELLKELCEASAVSGREKQVIGIMERELKSSCDSVTVDSIGNVVGIKKSQNKSARKIMIAGHMDEIGFVVSHIDKQGFIRFAPRGGHLPQVLVSQRVRIIGKKEIIGVVEGAPLFLSADARGKVTEIKDMYIDTGLNEKQLKKVIDIGDIIVLDRTFVDQGDVCISKAFDDRVGCYIVAETMRRLKGKKLQVEVIAVGSTQEEVGLRGASGAAKDFSPAIGIALDVTAAFDIPGVAEHQQVSKLGGGTAIKINDMASISNHGIVELCKSLAKKHKIKYQLEILPFGGTDAAAMQKFGEGAVCTLSVPTRYVHSPSEMIHKKDLEATVQLLVKFIENAHNCKLEF